MRLAVALLLLSAVVLLPAQTRSRRHSPDYNSLDKKLNAMHRYTVAPKAGGLATVMTDSEMDAWFAEGGIKWPRGVNNVHIQSRPAVVTGTATVDFDEITAGQENANPLMVLFTGVHDVKIVAQATAANGRGSVRVDSVSLDGIKVPRPALEFFVRQYLRPRYPDASLNSSFAMPNRIDTAIVGDGQITFIQK